jgi:hypothetical protein
MRRFDSDPRLQPSQSLSNARCLGLKSHCSGNCSDSPSFLTESYLLAVPAPGVEPPSAVLPQTALGAPQPESDVSVIGQLRSLASQVYQFVIT